MCWRCLMISSVQLQKNQNTAVKKRDGSRIFSPTYNSDGVSSCLNVCNAEPPTLAALKKVSATYDSRQLQACLSIEQMQPSDILSKVYWEAIMKQLLDDFNNKSDVKLNAEIVTLMTDPAFVETLGGMKQCFESNRESRIDKLYFQARAPFVHQLNGLKEQHQLLENEWQQCVQSLPKKALVEPPKKIEIIGAGMAGLCLAVRLRTKYPEAIITIHERRSREMACTRFQTLSLRFGRDDQYFEKAFEGTDFLGTPQNPGLFERGGAWKEPLRKGQIGTEQRIRAPIASLQRTVIHYLEQNGVTINFNSMVDPSHTRRQEDTDYRFITTGISKVSSKNPKAPFSLDHQSSIMHVWEIEKTDKVDITPTGTRRPGVFGIMNGGNDSQALGPFFDALKVMNAKGFIHHPDTQSRFVFEAKLDDLKACDSKIQINVDSSFYKKGVTKPPEDKPWYAFDIKPSIGMDPFYLAKDGQTIALGDLVNARHPYIGNGSLGIFKNIANMVQYIDRRQVLKSTVADSTKAQALLLEISQKRHQIDNMPELLKGMRQHLEYLQAVNVKATK